MAEYRLAPAAERDLEAIWVYTFHEWGSTQANRYIDRITKVFTELAHSPKTAQTGDHIAVNRHHSDTRIIKVVTPPSTIGRPDRRLFITFENRPTDKPGIREVASCRT